MNFFLSACTDTGILSVIYFIKKMMEIIFVLLPIILIVMISIDLAKNVLAKGPDDMKKNTNIAIKRILYCVFAFFVPTIVNLVINLVYDLTSDNGTKETSLSCWTNADKETIKYYKQQEEQTKLEEEEQKKQENLDKYNQNQQEQENNKITGGLSGNKKEENSTSGNSSTTTTSNNYTLYVGDSRTVGMCDSITLSSNEECKAQVGQGYTWLTVTAIHTINAKMKEHPDGNLVINLGINDLGNVNSYISTYKKFIKDYPNAKIVVVSLTPVENYPTITNSQVKTFNNTMKSGLSNTNIKYCDINDKITGSKITTDGVHHTKTVYKQIYELIKKCL